MGRGDDGVAGQGELGVEKVSDRREQQGEATGPEEVVRGARRRGGKQSGETDRRTATGGKGKGRAWA